MAEKKDKTVKDDSVPENDTLSEQEKEKVSEILENLKNSKNEASTDWDGLAEVASEEKEIAEEESVSKPKKSGKKKKKEEEEIPEEELCAMCGKRRRASEDTYYCKSCREKMKQTPLNFFGILAFVAVLFAGCVAIVFGYHAVNISVPVIRGDRFMEEGKYYSALASYTEAEQYASKLNDEWNHKDEQTTPSTVPVNQITWFDAGRRTKVKVLDNYYQMGSLISAQSYLEEIEKLGLTENKRYPQVKEYNTILDSFGTTCAFIENKYQDLFMAMQYSNGQMKMEDVKSTLEELEKLKTNGHHNKYAVAYMQYSICKSVKNSEDLQIKYLEEIKAGGKAYEETSNILLCVLYLNTNKYDKVEKICTDAVANAPESIDYYQYLMKVRIKQNNPQGALDIFDNVAKVVNSIYTAKNPKTGLVDEESKLPIPYTFYAEKAIAHALLGNADEAIKAIDESYGLGVDVHTANIYALLHYMYHVKGKEPVYENNMKIEDAVDNGYDIMLTVFASSNIELNKDVKAAIEGKKTLEEVFVDGEAYLQ